MDTEKFVAAEIWRVENNSAIIQPAIFYPPYFTHLRPGNLYLGIFRAVYIFYYSPPPVLYERRDFLVRYNVPKRLHDN